MTSHAQSAPNVISIRQQTVGVNCLKLAFFFKTTTVTKHTLSAGGWALPNYVCSILSGLDYFRY